MRVYSVYTVPYVTGSCYGEELGSRTREQDSIQVAASSTSSLLHPRFKTLSRRLTMWSTFLNRWRSVRHRARTRQLRNCAVNCWGRPGEEAGSERGASEVACEAPSGVWSCHGVVVPPQPPRVEVVNTGGVKCGWMLGDGKAIDFLTVRGV